MISHSLRVPQIVAYTSCALNYLPKARVLAKSLKRTLPSAKVVLCLNDDIPHWFDLDTEPFDACWHPLDYGLENAYGWIFKHDVMELCTAVKGPALKRLMRDYEADLFLYFDPDCLILSDPTVIDRYLEEASVGLTPHILAPEPTDEGVVATEMSVLKHGIYNLGFLAVRNDEHGAAFADWWAKRLSDYCYKDPERGLFTDQRWVDLAPALFSFVKVLRQPNLNVASWNLATRRITERSGTFLANGEPLVFYHFSGVGSGSVHQRVRETFDAGNDAAAMLEQRYEQLLNEQGQARLSKLPFAYDTYENGVRIDKAHRVTYRRSPDLRDAFPDPFAVDPTQPSFLEWYLENEERLNRAPIRKCMLPIEEAVERLVDPDFYLSAYPDAKAAVDSGKYASAAEHYSREGGVQGYDPNPYFDTAYYWAQVKDLDIYLLGGARCGEAALDVPRTPLTHYLQIGLQQRLRPSELFDNDWYELVHGDVAEAVRRGEMSCGFEHYARYGHRQQRNPGPEFSEQDYVVMNRDVGMEIGKSLFCAYQHYLYSGRREGRSFRPGDRGAVG